MEQLMELRVLQIKRGLLEDETVKVKLNPFLFAIPGICDPAGCSSWYETLESTLSIFSSPLPLSL